MNEDRILGCLLGLAVGDALGTAVEFQARDSFPPVTGMTGGGVFDLAPGQWTDDTSMALCIAASLTETGAYDPRDQLARFVRWYRDGYLSSTGRCFDIGNQTRAALEEFEATGEPYREAIGGMSSGNGSLMRLAPVAMAFCDDPDAAGRFSADSSRTTHPAVECVEACGAYGRLIAAAIEGASRTELYVLAADLAEQVTNPDLATILRGSYRVKERDEISSSGYVLHSLEAALWALARTDDFLEGALLAVNLGDDADTVGAIYGQLTGALYGRSGIPENWRNRLHDVGMIEDLAAGIADRVGTFEVVVG
ncbi:ADP-ribosylglycohydrolase family protein [Arachnia propionica]|uniref:ADP-ribosyl-[dinitrogen reductase] glycohydrolase n=1 Tax=Arachnia propionica TaxID=1750 RepID=A0A3S4W8W3_9ACTN|nr:ADP-ribosylglycohydrolase family protein [Arachnia propionica]VEH71517.1 ADP-ribosyl-[dinitrogen reductase] glycohydrolase [Arachnia propionica]